MREGVTQRRVKGAAPRGRSSSLKRPRPSITLRRVSSPQAGWYADPEDASHLRYWDGSSWTDHRAPTPPPGQYAPYTADVYAERADLGQLLTGEQREQYKQHALTSFPTWLVVVLHFLTLSLFTLIYQGLKFSKLPEVKQDDFRAGKAIGFMFIPFFNWYWQFRFALGLTDRLNFQFRLRGERPPVSRGLALASAIVLSSRTSGSSAGSS